MRRLGVDDLPALLELERAAQVLPWTSAALREELAHVDGEVLGVFAPALVGYISLRRIVDELWILNLATHPDHRRAGIASGLISAAKDRATSSAALWLEVREGNAAARALYEHHGFSVVGRRPGYYPAVGPQGAREAAVLMRAAKIGKR